MFNTNYLVTTVKQEKSPVVKL